MVFPGHADNPRRAPLFFIEIGGSAAKSCEAVRSAGAEEAEEAAAGQDGEVGAAGTEDDEVQCVPPSVGAYLSPHLLSFFIGGVPSATERWKFMEMDAPGSAEKTPPMDPAGVAAHAASQRTAVKGGKSKGHGNSEAVVAAQAAAAAAQEAASAVKLANNDRSKREYMELLSDSIDLTDDPAEKLELRKQLLAVKRKRMSELQDREVPTAALPVVPSASPEAPAPSDHTKALGVAVV